MNWIVYIKVNNKVVTEGSACPTFNNAQDAMKYAENWIAANGTNWDEFYIEPLVAGLTIDQ